MRQFASYERSDSPRSFAPFGVSPALTQGLLSKADGRPDSYRSSGDYCIPSKNSKDAFNRTGNFCSNGYRKSGQNCIATKAVDP